MAWPPWPEAAFLPWKPWNLGAGRQQSCKTPARVHCPRGAELLAIRLFGGSVLSSAFLVRSFYLPSLSLYLGDMGGLGWEWRWQPSDACQPRCPHRCPASSPPRAEDAGGRAGRAGTGLGTKGSMKWDPRAPDSAQTLPSFPQRTQIPCLIPSTHCLVAPRCLAAAAKPARMA